MITPSDTSSGKANEAESLMEESEQEWATDRRETGK